ncbi:transglutaminase family protein [Sphingobium yanoikuyae]|uniref:Transglutaminase family protein n=1 Tax=Sphingobium yanoikuyae TaxID=13690 RepID=A0AA42WSR9_SPHYA|nr:transglutaminase family protein [Sphingobium yanoikuyae]MDH2129497.1 transglutaminase family protein [Sphingobium yanoikuyae]MDH2153004.1 transglutaminase family protein [Sphingobium yanoikuyae]MDH2167620.1 transglutaminase family protein [Sphingobium yanoikuyae]
MPLLTIHHSTLYRYQQPVSLGEHRIMMRPREGFDQHLISARLKIEPEPTGLRWLHDVFGNSVAVAAFDRRTEKLLVISETTLEHAPLAQQQVDVEPYARLFPFTYSAEDMPDLLRSIERQHLDPERTVDNWARAFVKNDGNTETVALLTSIATSIKRDFTYVPRHEKGTQTPTETLAKRQGTCRDFAVLMIEAVRALGFAARFVSGYVYNPSRSEGVVGGGNTHAWVRIFLPGSGWVEFDPTNGIVGNRGLVRVAVARDPYQAIPLSGTWFGLPSSYLGMDVEVDVHRTEHSPSHSRGDGAVNSRLAGPSERSQRC